jgi:sulfur-oxidizing protein SoxZ
MARVLLNIPKAAKRGDVIEIRTLISHEMETGYRPGPDGRILPRNIITHVTCRWGEMVVFEAELSPAMSANPCLVFPVVATESGTITLTWSGDNGFEQTETATVDVS